MNRYVQQWFNLPAKRLECSARRGLQAVLPEVAHQELQSDYTHIQMVSMF